MLSSENSGKLASDVWSDASPRSLLTMSLGHDRLGTCMGLTWAFSGGSSRREALLRLGCRGKVTAS